MNCVASIRAVSGSPSRRTRGDRLMPRARFSVSFGNRDDRGTDVVRRWDALGERLWGKAAPFRRRRQACPGRHVDGRENVPTGVGAAHPEPGVFAISGPTRAQGRQHQHFGPIFNQQYRSERLKMALLPGAAYLARPGRTAALGGVTGSIRNLASVGRVVRHLKPYCYLEQLQRQGDPSARTLTAQLLAGQKKDTRRDPLFVLVQERLASSFSVTPQGLGVLIHRLLLDPVSHFSPPRLKQQVILGGRPARGRGRRPIGCVPRYGHPLYG
jgi:hypothetical protein